MVNSFIESIDIRNHPIKTSSKNIRKKYFIALKYITEKTVEEINYPTTDIKKYVTERLYLYQSQLLTNSQIVNEKQNLNINCLKIFARPWLSKYRYMFICDVALILFEESLILHATKMLKEQLFTKQQINIDQLISLLNNNQSIEKKYLHSHQLIEQYRSNRKFLLQKEKRIIVTANMSAGKSTLINALIGKNVARTSQEVCTGNVCYLFNKSYEDGNVHLLTQNLNLKASKNDLYKYNWDGPISIASYFTGITLNTPRLCMIDTPGVDAALYKEHSKITHNALLNDNYDIVIYIVSPTRLGTDAEKKHMKWVSQNLQKNKVIFVLNKIDNFQKYSDSIEESIHNFKMDLIEIGFENPIICPISAYFSYLLKLKITGQALSEDEKDEYILYSKKFMKSSYDLSCYYDNVECLPTDSKEITLSKRVGLYGLEKIIYGGK